MKIKQIAAAAALVTASVGASAFVVPWGVHDPAELGGTLFFGTGSSFPFEAEYTFTLSTLSNLLAVAVTNDAPGVFDINGATVSLYASNGDADYTNDLLIGSFAFDSTAVTSTFSSLAAGAYYYKLVGSVDGPFGGSYLLSSSLVPVPEPETAALLLGGLGALGLLARRRRS